MPLELLNSKYWAGAIETTYYQGLESLIWAFTFVLLNFDCDRKTETKRAASAWLTGDYVTCFEKKLCFLMRDVIPCIKNPPEAWKTQWPLAVDLLWVILSQLCRRQLIMWDSQAVLEPILDDTHHSCRS
ncbi:hypothetical protein FA95DRAFT_885332 [Auriscalpium vulgare]|uniref:Uncharacterized protein n=1 Tax=Auriscalpium vulgare TaxID=40419 RepID=A0ACB8R8F8_9AGAM|nr:hypothetical protein FA95DRAFT_885332 [Auriscalpium vulgare]